MRKIYERQVLANVFSISVRSDEKTFSTARLMPWTERVTMIAGEELCGPEDTIPICTCYTMARYP